MACGYKGESFCNIKRLRSEVRSESSPQLNMPSKKVLVVFGATGNQGGSVIKAILDDRATAEQFHIRAITRDPSKPAATALAEKGVTVLKVCFINLQSWFDTKSFRPIWTIKTRFVQR